MFIRLGRYADAYDVVAPVSSSTLQVTSLALRMTIGDRSFVPNVQLFQQFVFAFGLGVVSQMVPEIGWMVLLLAMKTSGSA